MGDDSRLRHRVIQFQDRCLHVIERDMTVENNKCTQKKRKETQQAGLPNSKERQAKQHASRCGSV